MDTVKKWLLHFMDQPLIRLPLTVVVLSNTKDNDFINGTLKTALEASTAFWRPLGIMLQLVVRGWQEVPDPSGFR